MEAARDGGFHFFLSAMSENNYCVRPVSSIRIQWSASRRMCSIRRGQVEVKRVPFLPDKGDVPLCS